jgi:hypothetical protein
VTGERTIRLLHVSDLHARGRRDGRRAWKRSQVLGDAWRRNLDDLVADGRPFDLVAFTGDIADWGLPEEYAAATPFVDELLARLGVPRERFFVVPGNHDVHRKTQEHAWSRLRKGIWSAPQAVSEWMADAGGAPFGFEPEWRDAVLERERAFWNWVDRDLGRGELLPRESPHGRLGYRVSIPMGKQHLHVIGLDTAWLAGDDADAGNLWLTDDQIGLLSHDEQGEPLAGFRLVLMHHPLSDLADWDSTSTHLGQLADLVLRGHQHTPVVRSQADPAHRFRELAAGCLYEGMASNRHPNACQVIDLEFGSDGSPQCYRIRFRAWSKRGHWHDDGALYHEARNGWLTWPAHAVIEFNSTLGPATSHHDTDRPTSSNLSLVQAGQLQESTKHQQLVEATENNKKRNCHCLIRMRHSCSHWTRHARTRDPDMEERYGHFKLERVNLKLCHERAVASRLAIIYAITGTVSIYHTNARGVLFGMLVIGVPLLLLILHIGGMTSHIMQLQHESFARENTGAGTIENWTTIEPPLLRLLRTRYVKR